MIFFPSCAVQRAGASDHFTSCSVLQPRNLLDVYVPYRHWFNNGPVPVLVFITGGAYIIGYKAWGALLARRLSRMGVLVVCLDYRNFPQVCPDNSGCRVSYLCQFTPTSNMDEVVPHVYHASCIISMLARLACSR